MTQSGHRASQLGLLQFIGFLQRLIGCLRDILRPSRAEDVLSAPTMRSNGLFCCDALL
jgi:hypothetical protein